MTTHPNPIDRSANRVVAEADVSDYPNMGKERFDELMGDETLTLTQQEIDAGWHFCCEWDGLLIHKTDEEFKACTCFAETAPVPGTPQGSDDSRPEIAGAEVGK